MPRHIVIVDKAADFPWPAQNRVVVPASDYVADACWAARSPLHVINLCRDYSYLSLGYYGSLLAEARGHKVIPSTEVMLDLHWKRLLRIALPEINDLLKRSFKPRPDEPPNFSVDVFFRVSEDPRLAEVARRAFELFRSPILSLGIRNRNGWEIGTIAPKPIHQLRPEQHALFLESLDRYTRAQWNSRPPSRPERYAIAVLHDPAEKFSPSNSAALKKFQRAGGPLGVEVELITRHDYTRLLEFDALLIRETTALDHHTYRFAKKAEAEGMPVIDDPRSILRCTNKIYLAEILKANGVATPSTKVVGKRGIVRAGEELGYPLVVKVPDSSFSRGVFKVSGPAELKDATERVLKDSDLAIVQEYVQTDYDWRIGVLDRRPLYACQYFMARNHWQIIKHGRDGRIEAGKFRTVGIDDAPAPVVEAATRAASLIGDGLYGVDVKETAKAPVVMEINDNPNIDAGVEDLVLKDALYTAIIGTLVNRLDARLTTVSTTERRSG